MCGHLEAGQLSPLPIQEIHDASNTAEALRHMQAGQHIGRFGLRMPGSTEDLPMPLDSPDAVHFKADASYLLVGGTGGLGRAISNWMAERGARHLVYLSRTAPPEDGSDFVRELAVQGCQVEFVTGSVTSLEDVQRAITTCCGEERPLKGVLQLSAMLCDRTFSNMTHKEWDDCLGPKVTGTWNLHEVLRHAQDKVSLDFFVLFGSLAGVYGNGGQANYAAANTYLESFVHYRRRLGLPCSLLNLGPVGDVGMLSRDDRLLRTLRETKSVQLLREADVCRGLGIAIAQSPVTAIMRTASSGETGALDLNPRALSSSAIVNIGMNTAEGWLASHSSASRAASWIDDARFALYANLDCNRTSKASIVDNRFYAFMAQIEENPAILNQPETELVICREIARLMTGYLGGGGSGAGEKISDEDIGNIAIDSLMAIEIKDWVRGNMNLDVSMDQTSRSRTSGELASHTVERLKVKYGLIES